MNRISVFLLIFLLATPVQVAAQSSSMSSMDYINAFAPGIMNGNGQASQFGNILSTVGAIGGIPGLQEIGILISIIGGFLDQVKPVSVESVQSAVAIEGKEAYDMLVGWGLLPDGMTEDNAVAVRVRTNQGTYTVYTEAEMRAAGWVRQPDGTWVPGPNARELPGRGSVRVTTQTSGRIWALANQDLTNVRVSWTIETLLPDGTVSDTQRGTELIVIPGAHHKEPMCFNVYRGSVRVENLGEAGFQHVYHSELPVSSLGAGEDQVECPDIPEQDVHVTLFGDSGQVINEFSQGEVRSTMTWRIGGSDIGLSGANNDDDIAALLAMRNNSGTPARTSGSGLGGFGGLGGLNFGSSSGISNSLRSLSDYRNTLTDPDDIAALNQYIEEEGYRLQNATSPVEQYRIGVRLKSVEEMIQSGHTYSSLREAIRVAANNPRVGADPITLLGNPSFSKGPGESIRDLINEFNIRIPAYRD